MGGYGGACVFGGVRAGDICKGDGGGIGDSGVVAGISVRVSDEWG